MNQSFFFLIFYNFTMENSKAKSEKSQISDNFLLSFCMAMDFLL